MRLWQSKYICRVSSLSYYKKSFNLAYFHQQKKVDRDNRQKNIYLCMKTLSSFVYFYLPDISQKELVVWYKGTILPLPNLPSCPVTFFILKIFHPLISLFNRLLAVMLGLKYPQYWTIERTKKALKIIWSIGSINILSLNFFFPRALS